MTCNRKMYIRCEYRNCMNTNVDVSMFRFPVNDKERLAVWIRNSGNEHLSSLPDSKLIRRFICMNHFHPKSIRPYSRSPGLMFRAVPLPFQSVDGTQSSADAIDQEPAQSKGAHQTGSITALHSERDPLDQKCHGMIFKTSVPQTQGLRELSDLRLKPPTKVYERKRPPKRYVKQNRTRTTEEAFFPSTTMSYAARSDLTARLTPRPGTAAGGQKSAAAASEDRDGEDPSEASESRNGPTCYACFGPIAGFRYSCVECVNFDLCERCEAMCEHPHHYMLRVPEHRPEAEVQAMLKQVRTAVEKRPLLDFPVKVKEEPNTECEIELEEEMKSDQDLYSDPHGSCGALPVYTGPEEPTEDPMASKGPDQTTGHQYGQFVKNDGREIMDNPPMGVKQETTHENRPSEVKTEPEDQNELSKRKKGEEKRKRKIKNTSEDSGALPVKTVKIEPDVDMNGSGETQDPAAKLTPESALLQVADVKIKEEPDNALS